ncbi:MULTISPECIES: helix-turn-helix transcriptional regulator [unclassified Streptomyces]|uniref:helix-turn-helix domain-containing protein n=1 Tax=unclassified Streptomyces TaxID=2593676 RepID=UPI0029AEE097|nr:helix-turn-helix transcriptional regulator [Streptomyces sp. FL07-04A]MDX3576804.1 helix-turn-helix transcriptional regulator [Streptomyces sp. FL07-04A]
MPARRVVTGRSQEPRRRFAEELRLLRAGKGDSLRQLEEVLGWTASTFGKMEGGQSLGSPEVVEALDQHYGTTPMLLTLWELAVADPSQFKEQYRRYMTLEAEAVGLWHYGGGTIHGLLQTPEYAGELLSAGGAREEDLNQQVEARAGRGKLLEGRDAPPFRAILSEAVLRNSMRDLAGWRGQLAYLAEVAERRNIAIHVLPFGVGLHGLMDTAVTFLRLLDGRTVAYAENDVHGELFEEASKVEGLHRTYDAVRDLALSPAESRTFILRMLEEAPCEPST